MGFRTFFVDVLFFGGEDGKISAQKNGYHFHPYQDDVDTLGLKQERTDFKNKGQIQIFEKPNIKGNKTKWNNWAVFTGQHFFLYLPKVSTIGPVLSQS